MPSKTTRAMTASKKTSPVQDQTIALQAPIHLDGIRLNTLTLRRPKVRDMLAIEHLSGSDVEKEIQLFANLCEVSPDCLHELDMADYTQLQQHYQTFLS